jgi:hypothetical protein
MACVSNCMPSRPPPPQDNRTTKMSECSISVGGIAHRSAMDAENRRLREILGSTMVELTEKDAIIGQLVKRIGDFEAKARRRGGTRLPNRHASIYADVDGLVSGASSFELVDRLPDRILHPLAPVGRKASVTTPTTCDSSGGDYYDKIDDDNYFGGSSGGDDESRLAERLERSLSSSSSSSSVTTDEEAKEKYPPSFAMDRNNPRRIGSIVSIGGPSSGEGGDVTLGKWRRTNDFEFDYLNSDIHRPTLTVLPMMEGHRSMERGRDEQFRGRRIIVGRRRIRRKRGRGGVGGIRQEHNGDGSSSCLRVTTAFTPVEHARKKYAFDRRYDRIEGFGVMRGSMSNHDVIRAYAEEILRRASTVTEKMMIPRRHKDDGISTETIRRVNRWKKKESVVCDDDHECWRGEVALMDECSDVTTYDDDGSSASAYFDCSSSTSDWRNTSAASMLSPLWCGKLRQTRVTPMSLSPPVTIRAHLDSPAVWIGITSIFLLLLVIFFMLVAFESDAAYPPLPPELTDVC